MNYSRQTNRPIVAVLILLNCLRAEARDAATYNLEVHARHEFFVGTQKAIAHNTSANFFGPIREALSKTGQPLPLVYQHWDQLIVYYPNIGTVLFSPGLRTLKRAYERQYFRAFFERNGFERNPTEFKQHSIWFIAPPHEIGADHIRVMSAQFASKGFVPVFVRLAFADKTDPMTADGRVPDEVAVSRLIDTDEPEYVFAPPDKRNVFGDLDAHALVFLMWPVFNRWAQNTRFIRQTKNELFPILQGPSYLWRRDRLSHAQQLNFNRPDSYSGIIIEALGNHIGSRSLLFSRLFPMFSKMERELNPEALQQELRAPFEQMKQKTIRARAIQILKENSKVYLETPSNAAFAAMINAMVTDLIDPRPPSNPTVKERIRNYHGGKLPWE